MRVNASVTITLTQKDGTPLPSAGWLNVFKKPDGSLVTGKKSYPTEADAKRWCRPGADWTVLGTIRIEEYLGSVVASEVAKQAVIAAYDKVLAAKFAPPKPKRVRKPAKKKR